MLKGLGLGVGLGTPWPWPWPRRSTLQTFALALSLRLGHKILALMTSVIVSAGQDSAELPEFSQKDTQ